MTDNLNPNYYKFPNGAETIDISQYLSGCGSQAVQYVVRSTRIDRDLKGNPLEDLRKAIWFINQEIERLEVEHEEGDWAPSPVEEAQEEPRIHPCESCNGSGSQEVADENGQHSGNIFNITLNKAEDIASDGLDLDEAASEVGNADAKHVGVVRAAKIMASNPGLYI